jgi:TolB-like protein
VPSPRHAGRHSPSARGNAIAALRPLRWLFGLTLTVAVVATVGAESETAKPAPEQVRTALRLPEAEPTPVAVLQWEVEDDYVPPFKVMMGEMRKIIIDDLKAAGFKVTPDDELGKLKGSGFDNPRAAGRQLGVKAVLACEVKRVGDKDTLISKLVDVENGEVMYEKSLGWQPTLTATREIKEKYAKEVAGDVRQKLHARFGGGGEAPPPPPPGGKASVAVLKWQIEPAYVPPFVVMMGEMRDIIIADLKAAGFEVKEGEGFNDPQGAGKRLGVKAVLACEVKRVGQEDTLISKLIDVESGEVLYEKSLGWQPTLTRTREIKEPFAKQVAEGVREKLIAKYGGGGGGGVGGPVKVAVLEWEVEADYVDEFKKMMVEMRDLIITDLKGAGIEVTPQAELKKLKGSGFDNPKAAGKVLGVQAVLACEVKRVGDKDTLIAKLIDVETGQVLYEQAQGWQPTLTATREIKEKYAKVVADAVRAKVKERYSGGGGGGVGAASAEEIAAAVERRLMKDIRQLHAEIGELRKEIAELRKQVAQGGHVPMGGVSVAVLKWEVEDDYVPPFKEMMVEMRNIIIDDLKKAGYKVTPDDELGKLKGSGFDNPRAAGRQLGVRAVVAGEVKRVGEEDTLILKLIDVQTGEVLFEKSLGWQPTLEKTRQIKEPYAHQMADGVKGKLAGIK